MKLIAIMLGMILILPLGSAFAEEAIDCDVTCSTIITETATGTDFVTSDRDLTFESIVMRVDNLSEKTDSNYYWGIGISSLIAFVIALGFFFVNRSQMKKYEAKN